MVRKQVYIEPRQNRALKRRAREMGVSQAQLIRTGIDEVTRAPAALYPDPAAWEEMVAYIRQHRMLDVPQTGRRWTREDLYEEHRDRS
jgi:hypothetical protein